MKCQLQGIRKLEPKKVLRPATTPGQWLPFVLNRLKDFKVDVAEAITCVTIASYFGWRASTVASLTTSDIKQTG